MTSSLDAHKTPPAALPSDCRSLRRRFHDLEFQEAPQPFHLVDMDAGGAVEIHCPHASSTTHRTPSASASARSISARDPRRHTRVRAPPVALLIGTVVLDQLSSVFR